MTAIMAYGQNELIPFEESAAWQRAYTIWLTGKRPHTSRAYARIVADFFQFANVQPAQVTGDMVNAWKLHLQSLGRKDTTIAQRLAGLSSFFAHLQRKAGLLDRNPVDMVERGDLNDSPYGNARPMTKTDFLAIWNQLDPATPAGAWALQRRARVSIMLRVKVFCQTMKRMRITHVSIPGIDTWVIKYDIMAAIHLVEVDVR